MHSLIHQVGKLSYKDIKQKALTKLRAHGFDQELGELVIEKLDLENDEDDQIEALKNKEVGHGVAIAEMKILKESRKLKDICFNMAFQVVKLIVS